MSDNTLGTVAIIGLGLMGSSLAMALKGSGTASKVFGYGRSADTVATALKLDVIDQGSCELKNAIKDADIIVICTPLGTYKDIATTISKHMKNGAILTDIGSVKHNPSWQILSVLTDEQKQVFVPGHPIAGSEKSGIEGKNPELYHGKPVILTPGPATSQHAIDTVSRMWEICGANTRILDADTHDEAYASVSHLVQLVAYASIISIDHYGNEAMHQIAQNTNNEFLYFTRISGSNPLMWGDIFKSNKSFLLKQADEIGHILSDMRDTLSYNPTLLAERISNAADKRHAWQPQQALVNHTRYDDELCETLVLLTPKIIAAALVEHTQYIDYAGSGFSDTTCPLLSIDGELADMLTIHKDELVDFLYSLCMEIESMRHIIQFGETEDIAQELASAQEAYDSFIRLYQTMQPSNESEAL
jgi:cyclohexadieny/prephenate dehydrogenase